VTPATGRDRIRGRARIFAGTAAVLAARAILLAAGASEKETVERFFKALDKKDRAGAEALLHPEVTISKLGEEKPAAAGSAAVLDVFLGRFPEFPNWSTKLGERIAAGPWVAVRERAAMERGEKPHETLFLFQVRDGKIRRAWQMEGNGEGGGEGGASVLVEKWNERDLPRFIAAFEGGASLWELPSGERLAAGEDALRDRFEKAFEGETPLRIEVLEHMSLSPWVVYRSRGAMDTEPTSGESLTIFETRDDLVRRVWYPR
jgi:hypothetical protein